MKTFYFSKARAIELQDTAKTVKELDDRAYKKSERFSKGTIQRLLTIASKKTEFERQKLELDQASVFVEMNDYKNAYLTLKKNGFETEAEAVKKYVRRKDVTN